MGSHIKNKYLLYENIISIVVCGILFVETPIFDNTIEGRTPLLPITVIVLTLTDYLFIGIKNRSKFTWTIVDYFLVLCLLMLSLSYFCNKYYGINYLYYSYLYCFVIYFFFRRYFSNMKIASMHLKLISTLSFFVAMLVIYHFCFTGNLKGFFRNNNFVGMYLGVTFPFQIALYLYLLNNYKNKKYYLSYVLLAIYISIIAVIITLCRSAIISIFLSSWFIVISHMNVIKVNYKLKTLISKYNKIALLIIFIISCFVLYYIKPISSISRILIWRVVCNIILQHPITGVGIGKLSNIYNLYQGEYFNSSHSTILQIASGSAFHAFNVPLEIAAELGVFGVILFFTLFIEIVLCAKNTNKYVTRIYKNYSNNNNSILFYTSLGASGCIIAFFGMTLFHFPQKLIPVNLMFIYALAWIVSISSLKKQKTSYCSYITTFQSILENNKFYNNIIIKKMKSFVNCIFMFLKKIFYIGIIIITIYNMLYCSKEYIAVRSWRVARNYAQDNQVTNALMICSTIYNSLEHNHAFLRFYADLLFLSKNNILAIETYEKAKSSLPDPFLYENLGIAYMNLTLNTKRPLFLIYSNIKYNELCESTCLWEKHYEFNECIKNAINNLYISSKILPWRLTPKYYLMNLYYDICNTNNAIYYATMVVNTPMKKYTVKGVEMKKAAQKMLNELGVPCDDPGIIVFDIHDRTTWNEGKW